MTLSTTESNQGFVGDGAIVTFAVTYKVLAEADLEVYLDNVIQVGGYTVVLNPDQDSTPGADVTFDVAPAVDVAITVLRVVALTQETDYQPFDAFPAESHESALDKLTMQTQQNAEALGRTPQLPVDTTLDGYDLGTPVGNTVIQYRADETGQESSGIDATSFNADVQSASDSAAAAGASETKAQEWAENPEDDPVETGPDQFSALHWAQKALLANEWDQYYAGFELGGNHLPFQGNFDDIDFNSKFFVDSTLCTNEPVDFVGIGIVETMLWPTDDTQQVQLLISMDNANEGAAWIRNAEAGIWTEWAPFGAGGQFWEFPTTDFTAEKGVSYMFSDTSGVVTVTMPPAPEDGDTIVFSDRGNTWKGTASIDGNGKNIEGDAIYPLEVRGSAFTMVFESAGDRWRCVGEVNNYYRGSVPPSTGMQQKTPRWFDTETGRSYVRFVDDDGAGNTVWVEENPAAQTPGGGTITLSGVKEPLSGVAHDIAVPEGVKEFIVHLERASFGGTGGALFIQLGTAGGIHNSGYDSMAGQTLSNSTAKAAGGSTYCLLTVSTGITSQYSGHVTFSLMDAATNTWSWVGSVANTNTGSVTSDVASGIVILPGALTQLRLGGTLTQAFDNGNVSLSYENPGQLPAIVPPGTVVQVQHFQDGELASSSATIPRDDNVVENTDGAEYMTLAFTPKYANSMLLIQVVFNCAPDAVGDLTVALFRDAIVNSIGNVSGATVAARTMNIMLIAQDAAGDIAERTYKVRAGLQAGTVNFNGGVATRLHAGTQSSTITITEIAQ